MAGAAANKKRLGLPRLKTGLSSQFTRAFAEGLVSGAVILVILAVWMFLRAGDTAEQMQALIPVKTAIIEVGEQPGVTPQPMEAGAPEQKLAAGRNIDALPPAPIAGLTEAFNGRQLPIARAEDELTPFQAYRKPFTIIAGRPVVSFAIVDFGLSETLSQSLLDNLPPVVTLVLNPYAANPAKWAAAARAFGHEFWMGLPMQTNAVAENDSGPQTILASAPLAENEARLFDVLSAATGYAGVVSTQNHLLSENFDAGPVVKQIFGRGLAFAESNPTIPAFGLKLAMEFGYPYVQNRLWLDRDLRPEETDRALKELETLAARNGSAVAFLHPYPAVVKKVDDWIERAEERGIQVAPLSALVQ